jgi:hypothetical protein
MYGKYIEDRFGDGGLDLKGTAIMMAFEGTPLREFATAKNLEAKC